MSLNIILENLKPQEDVLQAALDEVGHTMGTKQALTAQKFCNDLEVQRALYRIAQHLQHEPSVLDTILRTIVLQSPTIGRESFVLDIDALLSKLEGKEEVLPNRSYWDRSRMQVDQLLGQYSHGTT